MITLLKTVTLFQKMFSYSKVALKMELGSMKILYIINHGIRPYFKIILKYEILLCDCFIASFDESLNQVAQ